jgi:hypothetical protein
MATKGVLILAVALISFLSPMHAFAEDKPQTDELTWAKRVATEFFEAALSGDQPDSIISSPLGFLSPELAADMKEAPLDSPIVKLAWQYQRADFKIKSEAMSRAVAKSS